ncbi:serine/threonine-protein kinase Tel1p [[Candida] jaroonii]|uniref:Serine/threonine-protein kinase Tel1p n=1 Tax=[Candida] jaroonii TaxID=467808 RepID=A0ACA9Y5E8_9ASCO|nr:serine/threonine-protein kinase Tel1p [[Candida] jaroonii]
MRLDIGDTLVLLESSKIRDKNDGLERIESLDFRGLSFKQCNDIIKSLIRLIENEKSNDKAGTAATRKNKASSLIRSVIDQCIYKKPKYSSFINHILELANLCDESVLTDIIKSITLILNQQYIRDHLNADNWLQIFKFLTGLICDRPSSQLVDIFIAINTLVCKNSINYIPIYNIDSDRLLTKLESIRLEYAPLLANQYMIFVNRLLIVFSCTNFHFTKRLTILVFKALQTTGYNFNSTNPINSQIGIFLNIDVIHGSLCNYWSVDDTLYESIQSFLQTTLHGFLNSTKTLIPNYIGFQEPGLGVKNHTWFRQPTIYLRETDPSLYLLLMGCSKLLHTYFTLDCSSQADTAKRIRSDHNFHLSTFEDFTELVHHLLRQNTRTSTLALYLLTFYSEVYPLKLDHYESDTDFDMSSSLLFVQQDRSPILDSILSCTSNPSLGYWSLLCMNSLVVNALAFPGTGAQLSPSVCIQTFKLILPLVKSKDSNDIASVLLYNLVVTIISQGIALERDEPLINQINNIIELSYISGPAKLNNMGMVFWLAFTKLMSIQGLNIEVSKIHIINWAESKWDEVFNSSDNYSLKEAELINRFIDWLENGDDFDIRRHGDISSYQGSEFVSVDLLAQTFTPMFEFMNDNARSSHQPSFLVRFSVSAVKKLHQKLELSAQELSKRDTLRKIEFNSIVNESFQIDVNVTKDDMAKLLDSGDLYKLKNTNTFHPEFLTDIINPPQKNEFLIDEFATQNKHHTIFTQYEILLSTNPEIVKLTQIMQLPDWDKYFDQIIKGSSDEEIILYSLFLMSYKSQLEGGNGINNGFLYALGTGPLSKVVFERNELVTLTVSQAICKCEAKILKDAFQMVNWLSMAASKKLILTSVSAKSYLKMLLRILSMVEQGLLQPWGPDFSSVNDQFFQYFNFVSSDIRISLMEDIGEFFRNESISLERKHSFYKSLIGSFDLQTLESVIEYCMILGSIETTDLQISKMIVFNLLECASADSDYLRFVAKAASWNKTSSFISIFDIVREDILRSWWLNHGTFLDFPFQLLHFQSLKEFLNCYSAEIISVILVFKNDSSTIDRFFTKEQIIRSIPTAIPLAYVGPGNKHLIDEVYKGILGDRFKIERSIHLDSLIIQCFRLLDVSNMSLLLDCFGQVPMYDLKELNDPSSLHLSAKTGVNLIQGLIKKLAPDGYWTTSRVYFLVSRLIVDLEQSNDFLQKTRVLRRILMVMILGKEHLTNMKLIKLIYYDILVNDLETVEFKRSSEMDYMCKLVDLHKLSTVVTDSTFNQLMLIFSHLFMKLGYGGNELDYLFDHDGDNAQFFDVLNKLFKGQTPEQGSVRIKDFNGFKINGSFTLVFQLIQKCISEGIDITHDKDMVKALIHEKSHKLDSIKYPGEDYENVMKSWSLRTIANDIIDYGFSIDESYIRNQEFEDISDFESSSHALFETIYELRNSPKASISWISNVFIGIILGKTRDFDHLDYNFDEILVFNHGYEVFFKPDLESRISPGTIRSKVIEDFGVKEWINHSFIEMIDHISVVQQSPLLLVLKQATFHVDGIALKCFPYMVCYYLENLPKRTDYVTDLVKEMIFNVDCQKFEIIKILIKTMLLIRTSSTLGNPPFKLVYSNTNVVELCNLASKFGFFETALMLLEESITHNVVGPKWHQLDFVSDIYESINDEDLLEGLPQEPNLDIMFKRITRDPQSDEKLKYQFADFDSNLTFNLNSDKTSLLKSMTEEGLAGISSILSKTSNGSDDNGTYDWSWKLQNWDIPIARQVKNSNQFIYKTLKSLHDGSPIEVEDIHAMRIEALTKYNPKDTDEEMKEFYQSLIVSTQFCRDPWSNKSFKSPDDYNISFDLIENVLLARSIGFQITANKLSGEDRDLKTSEAVHELVKYNNFAIKNHQPQKIMNSILTINKLVNQQFYSIRIQDKLKELSKFQAAQSLWSQKHFSKAISMMKSVKGSENWDDKVMNQTQNSIDSILVGWLADSRQELSHTIMGSYVLPVDKEQSLQEPNPLTPVIYRRLAEFCEKQSKSDDLANDITKLEKQTISKRKELDKIKSYFSGTKLQGSEKKQVEDYYKKLKKRMHVETEDLNEIRQNQSEFKNKAVEYYLKSFELDDESIDKFFSLWLQDTTNDELNSKVNQILKTVPSHKLVGWVSQLISRLLDENNTFQIMLHKLIRTICIDHPLHSLYSLFSLHYHSNYINSKSNLFMLSKIKAASKIITALSMEPDLKYLERFFNPIREFCDESVNLAKYKQQSRTKFITIGKIPELKGYWIDKLYHAKVVSPTISIPISPTRNYYETLPYITSINPIITIANTGLSLPKIIKFKLSNGIEQKNLYKHGTDDLRQDTIMEQVFEKVNSFFQKDKDSLKRHLRVRTYKIVPIGPQSGIIEFVPNSMALNDIIKPYHSKDTLSGEKARTMMKSCQTEDKEERIRVFKKIINQINPVLRLFFFETFLKPNDWFHSKLVYSRGLATSSIVGHILGLGDRHCNNIMLDKLTGEPIHIDLGVAFDHGKRLPIPETIPFRLTRDLIDGLGVTGVDGIFRKNSELTLKVLRENQDHIMSILEILRFDPLYSWSLSPLKKAQIQNDQDDINNQEVENDASEAGQAVQNVSNKLQANGLSAETVVRELINSASNIDNLALIYCGWCPFY